MTLTRRRKGQVVCKMHLDYQGLGTWEISYVWTHPDHRRQGLANELLNLAKSKFTCLVGYVQPDETGLDYKGVQNWLKRHGFKHGWFNFYQPRMNGSKKRVMHWHASLLKL